MHLLILIWELSNVNLLSLARRYDLESVVILANQKQRIFLEECKSKQIIFKKRTKV